MKFNLKTLLYFPLIFFFLPAFTLNLTFLGGAYSVYPIFFLILYIALSVVFILKPKPFICKIKKVISSTPFKFYLIYVLVSILDSILLSVLGVASLGNTLRYILVHYILCIFPVFLYFIFIIDKYISYDNFIKIFTKLFYILMILGLIAYIGMFFNIEIIQSIFDFLANVRFIKFANIGYNGIASGYEAYGFPRLDCVFEEPSFYARFMFVFLPLIYSVATSKIKLYENNFANLFVKKTIIPLAWLNLILTQSPIYLILFFIITLLYFAKAIIVFVKRHILIFSSIFVFAILCGILIILNVNFEDTYLSRIITTVTSASFEDFVLAEPSLGGRIVCFINLFQIFLKHPFMGVGLGNLSDLMYHQLSASPVILTPEIYENMAVALQSKQKFVFNSNLFFADLAQYGFIIFGIFIFFHTKLKLTLNKIKTYNLSYNDQVYLKGLGWCWITLTIGYFYQFYMTLFEPLMVNILIITFIYRFLSRRQNEKNNIYRGLFA